MRLPLANERLVPDFVEVAARVSIIGAVLARWRVTTTILGCDAVNGLGLESLLTPIIGAVEVVLISRRLTRCRAET